MNNQHSSKIRVLIADDHSVVRTGLRMLLACEPDLEVVGEAAHGRQAVELARQLCPRIVLMDLSMDQLNGVQATRQILQDCPNTKIIAVSSYAETSRVEEALAAGVSAYLLKNSSFAELVQAIREVHLGHASFSPPIARQLAASCKRAELEQIRPKLTVRELEVLQLVAEGHPSKAIAADLGISSKTVERHRLSIMRKLNLHRVSDLVRYAAHHHIIEARPLASVLAAS